jgi:hypothetical protein
MNVKYSVGQHVVLNTCDDTYDGTIDTVRPGYIIIKQSCGNLISIDTADILHCEVSL